MEQLRKLKINGFLLGALILLLSIGLMNLYSAVYDWEEGSRWGVFWSQLVWVIMGLLLMTVSAFIDHHLFERVAVWFYGFVIFLLICVIFFGVVVNGTRGWLRIGPFSFQPAEFAKLGYVFIAARFFGRNPFPDGMNAIDLLRPAGLVLPLLLLIMVQGDLGTSIFLFLVFITISLFAGLKKRTVVLLLLVVLAAGIIFSTFFLKGYQRSRLLNFLNPEADMRGSGYQLVQSKIAVGSGGMFGKGYLKGNINKLRYLPERHTDFIFPVLAEEWGFAGSVVIVVLYTTILLSAIEIARRARDRFGIFLSIGITAVIFWQVTVNLLGVLGLMPLTGVPLPFMSYGGSSMIVLLVSVGLLLNIDRNRFRL